MSTPAPAPVVGVVGHVEWVTHALGSTPASGAIVDLRDPVQEPAGGGGVAAAVAARLGAACMFFTALGDDGTAADSARALKGRGVEVIAAARSGPQTPVLSITEDGGERTIMVVGPRMQPTASDDLPWDRLRQSAASYYAGEDPGALRHARGSRVLVVTARRLPDVLAAGVPPDVVVGSGADPDEMPWGLPAHLQPRVVVMTDGARGGTVHEGERVTRFGAVQPPGPVVDTYGCGDSFAAGLTVGLAMGLPLAEALQVGARAGAECATWRGGPGPIA